MTTYFEKTNNDTDKRSSPNLLFDEDRNTTANMKRSMSQISLCEKLSLYNKKYNDNVCINNTINIQLQNNRKSILYYVNCTIEEVKQRRSKCPENNNACSHCYTSHSIKCVQLQSMLPLSYHFSAQAIFCCQNGSKSSFYQTKFFEMKKQIQ